MSCLTTSATRRSRIVLAAVLIASAAASSHDVPLVPMISVTLYTLITLSLADLRLTRRDTPAASVQQPIGPGLSTTTPADRPEPGTLRGRRPGPSAPQIRERVKSSPRVEQTIRFCRK